MLHEEIIGKFREYRMGALPPRESAEISSHLENCEHCAMLFDRVPEAIPAADFTARVMANLEREPAMVFSPWRQGFSQLGFTAAAAALIIAAFWHPERSWVRQDKYFALFNNSGQPAETGQPVAGEKKERAHYE